MAIVFWAFAYLAVINLLAFIVFGWDKKKARNDEQRISESALLNFAFFGGSIGSKIAQKRFRHKTRKQPFALQLNAIIALQVIVICAVIFWRWRRWIDL